MVKFTVSTVANVQKIEECKIIVNARLHSTDVRRRYGVRAYTVNVTTWCGCSEDSVVFREAVSWLPSNQQ